MSFKIGDVSKLLGVSVETLRYYEQEGVIRPERKNYSTTRVYSIWDVYELMEFKLYRNIGLSINEIKNITQKGDIDYAGQVLSKRYNEIASNILYEQRILEYIRLHQRKLNALSLNIGNYWFANEPEKRFIVTNEAKSEVYTDFDTKNNTLLAWIKQYPFVKTYINANPADVRKGVDHIYWSIAAETGFIKSLSLPTDEQVRTIPPGLCLHTVVDGGEKGQINTGLFVPVLEYLERKGFETDGEIRGELVIRVYENECWHRYIELMIPVKNS